MTPAELYAMDGAAWLAAPVGEDAQPSEPIVRVGGTGWRTFLTPEPHLGVWSLHCQDGRVGWYADEDGKPGRLVAETLGDTWEYPYHRGAPLIHA